MCSYIRYLSASEEFTANVFNFMATWTSNIHTFQLRYCRKSENSLTFLNYDDVMRIYNMYFVELL